MFPELSIALLVLIAAGVAAIYCDREYRRNEKDLKDLEKLLYKPREVSEEFYE